MHVLKGRKGLVRNLPVFNYRLMLVEVPAASGKKLIKTCTCESEYKKKKNAQHAENKVEIEGEKSHLKKV